MSWLDRPVSPANTILGSGLLGGVAGGLTVWRGVADGWSPLLVAVAVLAAALVAGGVVVAQSFVRQTRAGLTMSGGLERELRRAERRERGEQASTPEPG